MLLGQSKLELNEKKNFKGYQEASQGKSSQMTAKATLKQVKFQATD